MMSAITSYLICSSNLDFFFFAFSQVYKNLNGDSSFFKELLHSTISNPILSQKKTDNITI